MHNLKSHIATIRRLTANGDARSLTYAALECRIALEMVCYERLRNAHDYISPKDLRKWQPGSVVQTLLQEVDRHAASSFTLEVGRAPDSARDGEPTAADYEKVEWRRLGTQKGFDPEELKKHWMVVGSFLHVARPTKKEDAVRPYADAETMKRKIAPVVDFLEDLAEGDLIMSGMPDPATVSFKCNCGTLNKRRSALLRERQTIHCVNRECFEGWVVEHVGEEIHFKLRTIDVECQHCGVMNKVSEKRLLELDRKEVANFTCTCGGANYVRWGLVRARKRSPAAEAQPESSAGLAGEEPRYGG